MRKSLVWILVVFAALTAALIWFVKEPVKMAKPEQADSKPGEDATKPEQRGIADPKQSNIAPAAVSASTTPGKSKEDQVREALSGYNDNPIKFYGKLIDQFGAPVAGAGVDFSIRINNGYEETTNYGHTQSDGNGLFTISGYKGQDLSVNPKKQGYALAGISGGFNYSHLFPPDQRVTPDPRNPVMIKMWKLQGAQPLISYSFETYVPRDGTPARFDLQKGARVAEDGDLSLEVESPITPSLKDGYDWRLKMDVVKGGLVQATNVRPEQMLGAPDSGYENMFEITYNYATKPWNSRFRGSFYFTSRDGRTYGQFSIQVMSDVVKDGMVYMTLKGVLNPDGSRDLEIDPKLVTEAHP